MTSRRLTSLPITSKTHCTMRSEGLLIACAMRNTKEHWTMPGPSTIQSLLDLPYVTENVRNNLRVKISAPCVSRHHRERMSPPQGTCQLRPVVDSAVSVIWYLTTATVVTAMIMLSVPSSTCRTTLFLTPSRFATLQHSMSIDGASSHRNPLDYITTGNERDKPSTLPTGSISVVEWATCAGLEGLSTTRALLRLCTVCMLVKLSYNHQQGTITLFHWYEMTT